MENNNIAQDHENQGEPGAEEGMKNKLTRLSIAMFVIIIAFAAVLIFVNPFALGGSSHISSLLGSGSASNGVSSGTSVDSNQNSTSSPSGQIQTTPGTSGLSQSPPTGTSVYHHHHDDSSGADYGESSGE